MHISSGGKAQYVVDLVRAEEVVCVFAVNIVVVDVTPTHKEIATLHKPAARDNVVYLF